MVTMVSKLQLCALARHAPSLFLSLLPQVLRLSSCERVSDAGIRALCLGPAALCLEDLNLSDCDRLTDKAPAVIGAHLQRLRLLSLEHCHRVGDR